MPKGIYQRTQINRYVLKLENEIVELKLRLSKYEKSGEG